MTLTPAAPVTDTQNPVIFMINYWSYWLSRTAHSFRRAAA